MADAAFEKYCFLRLYSVDLDTALHTLKVMRRYRREDVLFPLLRDVVVTYVRPFSSNKGQVYGNDELSSKKHVPKELRELHDELVRARKEQFAHTDLKYYRPKISNFSGAKRLWFPMAFRSYDYRALLQQLPKIELLIRSVETSVNTEIANHERNF